MTRDADLCGEVRLVHASMSRCEEPAQVSEGARAAASGFPAREVSAPGAEVLR